MSTTDNPEPISPPARPNLNKVAALSFVAFVVGIALGLRCPGSALAAGGTGELCNLAHVSVTKQPDQTLYVYEADCPGKPLGYFGGNVTAKYQVIGNWNPHTRTATDNVFSFDRNEGVFDTWTCSDDPWITAASFPNDSGGSSNGHTCQLKSHRGGDDWRTDTNPDRWFGDDMCFNDPWGASLAGCWSNGDLGPGGPSAAILNAWVAANAPRG